MAFRRKVMPGPAAATISPPRAGPAARAMLKLMEERVTAPGRSSRGTSSGVIACQAGPFIAAPSPRRKVKKRRSPGVMGPARVKRPRPAAANSIQLWVTRRIFRRSRTSARAPEGSERRNMGRLVTAWTSATSKALALIVAISHEAPTFCSQVPMFEATLAIHSQRKRRLASGRQGERGGAGAASAASGASSVGVAVAISPRLSFPGYLVGALEQGHGPLLVLLPPQVEADPAALRQDVVGLGEPGRHELVAHRLGKWDVEQVVAVEVADLAGAEPVFGTAKAVRPGLDPGPGRDGCIDSLVGAGDGQRSLLPRPPRTRRGTGGVYRFPRDKGVPRPGSSVAKAPSE